MGRRYANGRNTDHGPGAHKPGANAAVSVLSPYIRRRLVLESDAVAAALATRGPEDAEKFVQEVIWRGCFKGWLERRPQVRDSYRRGLEAALAALDRDRRLRRDVDRAMNDQTGLDCFDASAMELVDTGYLHNHARMWFALIWIFMQGLPWRLGTNLFYRHLLDGDAASNTLGWRWPAAPHTRGAAMQGAGLLPGPITGLGPRGINRRGDLTFGPLPLTAILCMRIAQKPDAVEAAK